MKYNKYYDCILKYKTIDKEGECKVHRLVVGKSKLLKKMFKYQNATLTTIDNNFYHTYNIELSYTEKSLLTIIDILYKRSYTIPSDPYELYDLLMTLSYLSITNETLDDVIKGILYIIEKIEDKILLNNVLIAILMVEGIKNEIKKGIMSLYYYLLEDNMKTDIKDNYSQFLPAKIYDNVNQVVDNIIILSHKAGQRYKHSTIEYKGLQFHTYSTRSYIDEDSTGFWLECRPINEKLKKENYVNLIGEIEYEPIMGLIDLWIFDGINDHQCYHLHSKNNKFRFPGKIDKLDAKRERYGKVLYDIFNEYVKYQFVITII